MSESRAQAETTKLAASDSEGLAATKHPISEAVNDLLGRIRALRDSYPILVTAVDSAYASVPSGYRAALAESALDNDRGPDSVERVLHEMPLSKHTRFIVAQRRWLNARNARRDVPRALLLALMAHWDAFLADLVRALYESKGELTGAIEKSITYQELASVGSLAEARELGTEKDISDMLHRSRIEQLKWFERRMAVSLRHITQDHAFVELCERRNVIAHNGGRATTQYIIATRAQAHTAVGNEVRMDEAYIEHAYQLLFEMGVQLAHLSWRQVLPADREIADKVLARTGYELLVTGETGLALRIHEFAVSVGAANNFDRRRFVINLAQSHKWLGDHEACEAVIASEDWSGSGGDFALALAVLRDDFDRAAELMESVGGVQIEEQAFIDWPLFREFRRTDRFALAYERAFGRAFDPTG